jgi:hypothetical protein
MATVLPSGLVPDHITRWNANACRIDKNAQHGGGGIAICSGFDLTASGLVATICAGGPGEMRFWSVKDQLVALNVTGGLSDGGGSVLYNYLWYSVAGVFDKTTSSNPAAPPGPPGSGGPWGYVGRISTTGGAQTGIDTSGQMLSRGGLMVRQTADVGPPTDSPPASLRFLALTLSGYYLWDGPAGVYRPVWQNVKDQVLTGEGQYLPVHEQRGFWSVHQVRGTSAVRGYERVRA